MATYSYSPVWNLTTKKIEITDTTDYAGQGLTIGDYNININVTLLSSTGEIIVYTSPTSSFDIVPSVSRSNVNSIAMPVDASGVPLEGIYTIDALYYNGPEGLRTLMATVSNDYTYINPCVSMDLQAVIDCGRSTIVSTDETVYGPTVISISRVHKVFPPAVLGLAPFENALASLTITGIYTSTWTQQIVAIVTFLNSDGTHTTGTYRAMKEFTVVCDDDMCKIICCLNNLKTTYDNLLIRNPTAAAQMKEDRIDRILADAMWYKLSRDCGNSTKAAKYLKQVMDDSGCTVDCDGCNSALSTPTYIVPTGASTVDTYNIISPDNSINVLTGVTGSTTTFYIQVSSALQTLISSFYKTTVSTSTPSYLTVVASGTNPKNYAVNFTGTIPAATNRVHLKFTIKESGTTNIALLTVDIIDALTGKFKIASGIVTTLFGSGAANAAAYITITNFLATGTTPYIAHANLMGYYGSLTPTAANVLGLEVHWFDPTTDTLVLRLVAASSGLGGLTWKDVFDLTGDKDLFIALSLY